VDLPSAAECIRSGADGVAVAGWPRQTSNRRELPTQCQTASAIDHEVRGLLQSLGPEDSEAKAKARVA